MSIQIILVVLLFAAAVFYVGRLIYKSLTTKKSCGSNCKCGVNFPEIVNEKPHN